MTDYETIRDSVLGYLSEAYRVPWAENISREGTAYAQAYQDFWTAREHLCERFQLDWEDDDLELIMNAVLLVEKDVARGMFDATLTYAEKGRQL
ncbi:MAG: hypothetical protein ACI3WQ_09585 [Faecousia sp.]